MVRIYVSVFGVANFSWISLQVGKIFKKRGFREALQSSRNDARPFLSHTRTPFFWWTILFTTMVSTHYAHIIHIYPFHQNHFSTISQSHILDRLLTSIKEGNYAKLEFPNIWSKNMLKMINFSIQTYLQNLTF